MKGNEKKETWEKRIPLLAAFLLPLLLVVVVCISHEVYPFGERCILHIDMYHQYCPFFTELMHKLKTGGSIFYTWNVGLGVDFVSLYAYYLASPLNWLLLFCPQGSVIEFMTILVALKIALCGLTFGCYLKYHFKTNHFAVALFATAYALSAFVATYAWNIMWMDCVVLAPLILLGLERLIKEKKPGLYYVTLAICILSNYYISIMVCIFLVFWFLLTWTEHRESGIGAWLRFAGYSLLAGGTGAVLIIPEAVILSSSGSKHISFPDTVEWYFNILAEVARHSVMVEGYTGREHWPNLYCGIFTVLLFAMFFFNREISWKKKLAYGLFFGFFLLSFANNMLDFIWHGFHFPDSLPGRQSFLYIFLLLVVACETFLHFRGNRLWHVAAAALLAAGVLGTAYYFSEEELITGTAKWVTLVFLAGYAAFLLVYFWARDYLREPQGKKAKKKKKHYLKKETVKGYMMGAACFAMLAELLLNFNLTGLGTTGRTAYVKDLADYREVLAEGEKLAEEQGISFYRTEKLERRTKNDAALSGYRSATQFSSLMNLDISHFYQAMGMEGGKNFYCVNGATPLLSAMLSLKYVIADNGEEENPIRSLVAQSGETYLYENKYVLPLGFLMPEEVISAWNYKDMGEIEAQNELAYLLGAKNAMLTEIPSVSETGVSTIPVTEDAYIFATYEKTALEAVTEEISDGRTKSFTKVSHGYTLDLGYCNAGDEIRITNTKEECLNITAYRLDLEAVEAAYQTLNAQTMELTSFSDTKITGKIQVEEEGRLIFSIANDDGWKLFVDGKETELEVFGEGFISVSLEEGSHEIVLSYRTPGFVPGALVSGGCVAVFLLIWVWRRKREKIMFPMLSRKKKL